MGAAQVFSPLVFSALNITPRLLPCWPSEPAGAGDAYFAITAMLAANKSPAEVLGFVGNTVGAIAVEVVCNRSSINAVALYKYVKALLA